MFYLLHKRKLLPIDPDRIYTFCPRCGTLHAVDLCATNVYCEDCSAVVRAEGLAATEKEK